MKDFNYSEKINNAKSKEERYKINDEFLKYRRKIRKIESIKKFCIDNFFNIVNSIVTILALIVAILSLLLQLKGQQ